MTQSHEIRVGDCLDALRAMPDQSFHCCITSPPYFGLRDYGVDGQIGLEQTPAEFVSRLVEVFREVRRVLRDDGTLWLNIGDSYASTAPGTRNAPQPKGSKENPEQWGNFRPDLREYGIKPKDLMGIPWRLAFALQDDGWYLRQDIIWHKPNPMPESVRDRCTKAHEYLFLLSKSPRYHFDQDAIAEPLAPASVARLAQDGWDAQHGSDRVPGKTNGAMKAVGGRRSKRNSFARETKSSAGTHGQKAQHRPDRPDIDYSATRNKRSVWTVPTAGFKGAHFATFPPDLIRPCVLAGAPRGGLVLDPFGGAGTTALVAMQEGRRSVLLELNPEYASIARHRLASAWLEGAAQLDLLHDQKESVA
ncbi:site-specific DNA-methyltransferase [Pseudomonas aeruginosa]|uniref:DNA-methyltransferase n=1 Tax=Pseudomonas aeruginosa TaxID=287 RepID=UPI001C9E1C4B|nr:site-specific DNA-methyltransferase [Pseudomonas aeruginosa]MBY9964708.1 site-specific DNA-methyltransferase [Pseudomonas aeruginosa]MBY9971123.1 site-specific DNA-methyltransferase [Pseudomonas aeruginosa]MBY9977304.1 site-specific DNA-methyltransferase [Pseudomonas aeruginosa]MBY9983948.1 site-specific DNA-methyltransferase [Pseudomonas aeruginosa]MBY9991543.1 site-specific DNA-methyltransferase [Pseudomonas aeruginosa]